MTGKIRICFLITLISCASCITYAQEAIFRMSDEMIPVQIVSTSSQGRISGQLMQNWQEDSAWADVRATYRIVSDEDSKYLSVDITDIQRGRCQFSRPINLNPQPTHYRLSFMARMQGRAKISLGVRMRGKPYTWLKKYECLPHRQWQHYAYDFTLNGHINKSYSIMFTVDNPALLDLRDIKFERSSLPSTPVNEVGGNFFRNSSFPLGLQSGWTMHSNFSEGDDVIVQPDPEMCGPSHEPALFIKVLKGVTSQYGFTNVFTLYSAPFSIPELNVPYTASMYIEGQGQGSLTAYCGNTSLGQYPFILNKSNEWRRIELPFTPNKSDIFHLRVKLKGAFHLDAFQINTGTVATIYQSQKDCDVAISQSNGDANRAGIWFSDEVPILRYAISGQAHNATLNMEIHSLYGLEKTITIPLTNNTSLQQGTFNIGNAANLPFGPLRIEAWVTSATGKIISPFNEMVINLLHRPHYWGKDAPASAFGTHIQPIARHLIMAKAIGNNWVRLHDNGIQLLGWTYLERSPGKWTFDDAGIQRYRNHHLKILGMLSTAPAWASYASQSTAEPLPMTKTVTTPFFLPLDINAFAAYARKVVMRYQDQIDCYDVWNEPWLPWFFHVDYVRKFPHGKKRWASFGDGWYVAPDDPAAEFLKLQQAAYKSVKSVNPQFNILGFNTSTGEGMEGRVPGRDFTTAMLQYGAIESCDVICYHQYLKSITGYPGDEVSRKFTWTFDALIEKYGMNFPHQVWLSEGSPLQDPSPGFYHHTISGSSIPQLFDEGDRVVRFVVSLLANGVEKIFLYAMSGNAKYFTDTTPYRMFITANGDLHPTGCAYSVATWFLEDKNFIKVIKVGENVNAYLFAGKGKSTAILLVDPRAREYYYKLPAAKGIKSSDLFGNALKSGTLVSPYATYITYDGSAERLESLLLASISSRTSI